MIPPQKVIVNMQDIVGVWISFDNEVGKIYN